jgi:hypothetical protein
MQFLSGIHLIGAILGFVTGLLGFIIVRFWILPVTRYTKLRRRLLDSLPPYRANPAGLNLPDPDSDRRKQEIRHLAADISDSFSQDLPNWYRIMLKSRGEAPDMAAATLLKLVNTRDPEHVERQAERIRHYLNPGATKSE